MCAIDLSNQLIPSSTFAIQLDFALQFGLIKDDKNNQYRLGPNLEYELPQVSYTSSSVLTKTNTIYPWLGDHYLGINPQDVIGTTELFNVTIRGSSSGLFVHLARRVQWRFINLNTTLKELKVVLVSEVEIATPDGPLSILPPGKTIVTLEFRRV